MYMCTYLHVQVCVYVHVLVSVCVFMCVCRCMCPRGQKKALDPPDLKLKGL